MDKCIAGFSKSDTLFKDLHLSDCKIIMLKISILIEIIFTDVVIAIQMTLRERRYK